MDLSNSKDELLAKMRQECTQLSLELEKTKRECSRLQPIAAGETTSLHALVYQEQRLKAELQLLKEQPPESLVRIKHAGVVEAVLLDELRRTNRELEESLVAIRERKTESDAELKRLSQHLTEFKNIHGHLEARCSEGDLSSTEDALTRDQHQEAVDKKRRKAKAYYNSLSKEMDDFVSQHFGSPTDEEQSPSIARARNRQGKKSLKQSTLDLVTSTRKEYKSMTEMIDELTDVWLESAHHPYKVIPDDYWPPYIRLLLTAGIARLNPSNSNQIQLVPCFR
ncbi:centromere protein K-like [Corticium candelabrum]|uniref:centromere protein K-like n=1 Tax=Corticium candelabrum TaxID=121492 RepID=UPI002E265EF6|nr:centromere protein K-like [Corticium candelabrum]